MVYKLKALKNGYIRAKNIKNNLGNNQIKIGSKQYNLLTRWLEPVRKKGLQSLIKLETGEASLKDLRRTTRANINWNPNQQLKVYNNLKRRLAGKPHIIYFKSGGRDEWNSKALTINNNETLKNLIRTIGQTGIVTEQNQYGSDVFNLLQVEGIQDFKFEEIKPTEKLFNKSGSFFPHLNKTENNLEKYQILSKDSQETLLNQHCIIYALSQYNIDYRILSSIMTTFENGFNFPKSRLYKVSEAIKKTIILYEFNEKKQRVISFKYGKYNESIDLGLYENHYFIYDTRLKFEGERYANIILYIKHLKNTNQLEIDFFKDRPEFLKYQPNNKTDLSNIKNEQQLIQISNKEHKPKTIFYADCEAQAQYGEEHIPLSIGVIKSTEKEHASNVKIFSKSKGQHLDFINKFLDYIIRNTSKGTEPIVYFHNLKYDFHLLNDNLTLAKPPLEKDGQVYEVYIRYKSRTINLRDSYKFIGRPLSEFNGLLNLPKDLHKKDSINYTYYTYNNYHEEITDLKTYMEPMNETDKINIIQNLKAEPLRFEYDEIRQTFNPKAYYEYYLCYDVLVLKAGMNRLDKCIDEITEGKIYIHDYRTISSLAYTYAKLRGCLDGVYQVKGNLRRFISQAQQGGRVIVNEKAKMKAFNINMADADINSLYGAAMAQLDGWVIGESKRIGPIFEKKHLDIFDYYIVEVSISKINTRQQIPIIGIKNSEGVINYINEITGDPKIITIDKTTLNEYIKLHDIEYKILDGVYWNQAYNPQLPILTDELYKKRLAYKSKKEEALQLTTKLIINSIYGKAGTCQNFNKNTLIDNKNKNSYIFNNFRLINSIDQINKNQCIINMKTTDESYNEAHLACQILSKSKAIMNRIFFICNKYRLTIYYTDTDSIHIEKTDLEKLESEYRKEYGQKIIGKELGLLSNDFQIKGCSNVKAIKSIFISPKIYYDKIQGTNEKGEIITAEHARFKGMPSKALSNHAKEHHNGSLEKLYENIIETGSLLDVIQNPKTKIKMEFKNHAVKTLEPRTIFKSFKFI